MDVEQMEAIVGSIPAGHWVSYGDVARAAGGTDLHARALNGRFIRTGLAGAHRVLKSDGTVGGPALGAPGAVGPRVGGEGLEFTGGRPAPARRGPRGREEPPKAARASRRRRKAAA